MVADPGTRFVTSQEYLEREAAAETKSEYYDGVIVAMSGSTPEHELISGDIHTSLNNQLRGTPCKPFTGNMRVHIPARNRYFYPDVSATCVPRYQTIAGVAVLENPALIVEVLSKSNETIDRGAKLSSYRSLESLETYLIVSQDRPYIEVYERLPEGSWRYSTYEGLQSTIALPAIGCDLRLTDVYASVEFPADAEQRDPEPTDPR